jgi:predicted phosphodiesterase
MNNGVTEGVRAPFMFNQLRDYISQERKSLLGCAAVGAVAGLATFGVAMETSSTETELSGHRVIVETTRDARGTLDLGFISARTDTIEGTYGFGAKITVKEALNGFEASFQAGSEIVQDPYETLTRTEAILKAHALRSAVWALGMGLLAGYGTWRFIRSDRKRAILTGGLVAAVAGAGWAETRTDTQVEPAPWIDMKSFILSQYREDAVKNLPPELRGAQIRGISDADKAKIVNYAEEKLVKPQEFVDAAWENFSNAQSEKVAAKKSREFRVGVISDIHDNTFMADLAGKTLDAFDVDGLVFAGDGTSSGLSWEQFSANAIVNATTDIPFRGDVIGNHDTEESQQPFRDAEFTDLNDGKVHEFGPLKVAGVKSNQYTALGRDSVTIGPPNRVVAQALADEVCAEDEAVDLTVVHEPVLGNEVAEQGCSEIVVAGHMHDQVSPTPIVNTNGTTVYRMINGTTGGADIAFAFGKPINPADITVLTYTLDSEGEATFSGWQHVRYLRNTKVEISDFTAVEPALTRQDLAGNYVLPMGAKLAVK